MHLTPSGFVVTGPTGVVGTPNFLTNVGNTTTLTVMTARLNSSFVYQESQVLRGGFSVAVPLVSSIPTFGSLNPVSRTFTAGDSAYTTTFTALATGNTILSATPPATFSLPAGGANGIQAQVNPGLAAAPNVTVGQSLEVPAQITLTGAPSTATTITLTSSDPSQLRFGVSATDAGAGTIPIPGCTPPAPDPTNACKIIKISAGQSHSPDIYFQGLASTGSVTYTANIPNIGTSTGTVTLRPSGILIAGPFGRGNSISTTSNSATVDLSIQSAMLDTARNFVEVQAVAAITGVPAGECQCKQLRSQRRHDYGFAGYDSCRLSLGDQRVPAGDCRQQYAFGQRANRLFRAESIRHRDGKRVGIGHRPYLPDRTPPASRCPSASSCRCRATSRWARLRQRVVWS